MDKPRLSFRSVDTLFSIVNYLRQHLDRGLDDAFSFEGKTFSLDVNALQILMFIAQHEGEQTSSSAKRAGQTIGLPKGTTRDLVAGLKSVGLVEVDEESPWSDGRRKPLRLTDDGAALLAKALDQWNLVLNRAMASIDEDSVQKLAAAMESMRSAPSLLKERFDSEGPSFRR